MNTRVKIFSLLLILCSSVPLFAKTVLIETRMSGPEPETAERVRVSAAETGLMDELFNAGHIFFNFHSVPGDAESLGMAAEEDADFLIVLTPQSDGMDWRTVNVSTAQDAGSGTVSISQTDPNQRERDRWKALGFLTAGEILPLIK